MHFKVKSPILQAAENILESSFPDQRERLMSQVVSKQSKCFDMFQVAGLACWADWAAKQIIDRDERLHTPFVKLMGLPTFLVVIVVKRSVLKYLKGEKPTARTIT